MPLNDAAALEDIRRTNLHVLTTPKGSKVRLGAVMEISGPNMANRLYGQKRMNDTEANRFTERLGLPTGWLDVPRSVTDIPTAVADLLVPASRRRVSAPQELPPALEPTAKVAKRLGNSKQTASARIAPIHDTDGTGDPTGVAAEANAVKEKQDQVLTFAAEPAIRHLVDKDISFPTVGQQFAPASVMQVIAEPHRLTSATSLDDLHGIEPIAEALIKTLAGKARTGRLDETKALELLRQSVLL